MQHLFALKAGWSIPAWAPPSLAKSTEVDTHWELFFVSNSSEGDLGLGSGFLNLRDIWEAFGFLKIFP